ncbi:MAG: nucleotidyl transferase AbiEii/AbiGii toxin family protein [Candidatus Taylorbacteria bacterium]
MVSTPNIDMAVLKSLHLDVLPQATKEAFLLCISNAFFSSGGWYLAGGTALALQVGHRSSVDLDFFTPEKSFDEKKIEETLSTVGKWKTSSLDRATVYGELNGAKVSLIAYPFIKFSQPFLELGSISLVKPEDIAAMKIIAICQRGKKRDFFDLYWLSAHIQTLMKSIESAQNQYTVKQNPVHILKSLVYFEDAENDPDPVTNFKADWKMVKNFFEKEVPRITKALILSPGV